MMMHDPYAALQIRAQNRDKLPAIAGPATAAVPARRTEISTAKPATQSASRFPYVFTQGDLDKAVANARTEERARISAAFNAEASHGRERVCATLLTSTHNFTGSAIASQLAHMPTDAERARAKHEVSLEQASAVWDGAYAKAGARPNTATAAPAEQQASQVAEPAANDPWARAWATVQSC